MVNSPSKRAGIGRSPARMALLLAAAFVLGGLAMGNLRITWREPAGHAEPGPALGVSPGAPQPLAPSESYARAAQIASPSVVNIDTQQRVAPDMMEDWFNQGPRVQVSEGSGVIIDKQGDILTNEHVVGGVNVSGRQIMVALNDGSGRKVTGTVIGADHQSDVALVHIDAANLPVARMGTVNGLVPGQMAVAIGNPLGYRFTVTHGVVSALGRPITDEAEGRSYENLIQTDCAINPGNSGGALVNIEGQVIGINTIVATHAQGIGFAIPIDIALRVASELKQHGRIKRPSLGVIVMSNSSQVANYYGLPDVPGVVAARITRNGPAAQAGIRPGDVIIALDHRPVHSEEEFKAAEKKEKIGQKVEFTLRRGDQNGSGTVTVGEAP